MTSVHVRKERRGALIPPIRRCLGVLCVWLTHPTETMHVRLPVVHPFNKCHCPQPHQHTLQPPDPDSDLFPPHFRVLAGRHTSSHTHAHTLQHSHAPTRTHTSAQPAASGRTPSSPPPSPTTWAPVRRPRRVVPEACRPLPSSTPRGATTSGWTP